MIGFLADAVGLPAALALVAALAGGVALLSPPSVRARPPAARAPGWRGRRVPETALVVLSDLDGVLVDSRGSVVRAWERFADRHRLPLDRVLAATFAGPSREVVAVLAGDGDVDAEAAMVEAWQVEDAGDVTALPGAAALLAGTPPERLAVVTSCSGALARARLAAAGLPEPRVMITAELVRAGKPDPEGYLLAAARLGAVPPIAWCWRTPPASGPGWTGMRGVGGHHLRGRTSWGTRTT